MCDVYVRDVARGHMCLCACAILLAISVYIRIMLERLRLNCSSSDNEQVYLHQMPAIISESVVIWKESLISTTVILKRYLSF